jgi:hypothetical protein
MSQRSPEEQAKAQKKKGFEVLATGVGLTMASVLGLGLLAGKARTEPGSMVTHRLENSWKKTFSTVFNQFDLKGEGAYQIGGGWPTLLFWGLPAYLGWIHASRSSNERRERILQMGNSIFWFFGMPVLGKRLWNRKFINLANHEKLWDKEFTKRIKGNASSEKTEENFKNKILNLKYSEIDQYFSKSPSDQKIKAKLLSLKNSQYAVCSLGVPIISMALLQLFNFRLTEYKIKQKMSDESDYANEMNPLLS